MTETETFQLAPQQEAAAELIQSWWNEDEEEREEIFRLFGYAGTGKTTTIKAIISRLGLELGSDVLFAAFTGKAALVMQRQGLPASTIHSLIYKPVEPDKRKCAELHAKLKACADPDEKKRIRFDLAEASKVTFHLRNRDESLLADAQLLVLDECSMVNGDMLTDLLKFHVPLLVLGDPGQLPPIEGESPLTSVQPNYLLTEIHRQARDNPIIDFATRARNGSYIPKRQALGSSFAQPKEEISTEIMLSADQVLCGKNATRKMLNQRIRALHGRTTTYPEPGDKIICLRNNAGLGLFNGMLATVVEVGELLDASIELKIRLETQSEDAPLTEVRALRAHFDAYYDKEALDNIKPWERRDNDEFDFGYAITVHKSQGSQWDRVVLWDDKFFVWDKPQRKKWLYTGITRAAEDIIIAT